MGTELREDLELATDEHLLGAEPERHLAVAEAKRVANRVGPDRHGERRVDRDLAEVTAGAPDGEQPHSGMRRGGLDRIDAEPIRLEDDPIRGVARQRAREQPAHRTQVVAQAAHEVDVAGGTAALAEPVPDEHAAAQGEGVGIVTLGDPPDEPAEQPMPRRLRCEGLADHCFARVPYAKDLAMSRSLEMMDQPVERYEPAPSRLDASVNFVKLADVGRIEARYVRRTDDYVVVYLSSQTGCRQACRMCHLTATGQTKLRDTTREELLEQADLVLDHYRAQQPARSVHFNFMARGEPMLNHTVLHDSNALFDGLWQRADAHDLALPEIGDAA